ILLQGTHLFVPERAADPRWDVRIYGSDISRRCVAMARRGIYGESSFRVTSKETRRAFFHEKPEGWQVSETIRSMCHFGQMNLLDEDRSRVFGNADVIFCRNVLIYFDARARKAAIDILYERLNPGGILLLGHSESLLNVTTAFELLHLKDDLLYRKPGSVRGASAPPTATAPPAGPSRLPTPFAQGSVQVSANRTKPIRVLVVDDSAYNRRSIAQVFADHPEVEVVGKAADGEEALKLVTSLKPDVITLDLEMPRMDGFTFLRILMAKVPTPVIVVSSYSQRENVFKALELGALDFVPKPDRLGTEASDVRQEILQKVLLVRALRPSFVPTSLIRRAPGTESTDANAGPQEPLPRPRVLYRAPKVIVAIASSTGGPSALLHIFGRLPSTTSAAFVVAQHMPDKFTRTFAERLDKRGPVRTVEASDGDIVSQGTGFICPGRKCMELVQQGGELKIRVDPAATTDRYVPSADRLFKSVAALGPRCIGVILTGMGDDGVEGARMIRDAGGTIIAESQETAVVNGMPGAAVRAGVANSVLPLPQIGDYLARLGT
ncbi:MAG: chemotaxis-specific protein-glutamate methyltransferase CheB, partial [Myxococcota bacterium]|nr:chemotaxis-specific protein-glutamate methyltransferase CheB [Myxococcota bacterium]